MTIILITIFIIWYLVQTTWTSYLAVMKLKDKQHLGFTKAQKFFGYPLLFRGYIIDVLLNVIVGSIIFLELPRELLFTTRVSRWNDFGTWRGDLARFLCAELLDPFEEGGHCD